MNRYPMFSALWVISLEGAHARETTGYNPYQDADRKEAWDNGWNGADIGIGKLED